ncbi:hypothetical protein BCD67_00850 [Oscillatoriales cyanobacterium USR001]|nr:hypothetical protein BCD67_00850 [Oscillatoriales cyanobacterium USR001]
MFLLLVRIILLLLIVMMVKNMWDQAGSKDSVLLQRLLILLVVTLAILSFFAPDSSIGATVLSVLSFILKPLGLSIILLVAATAIITNGGIKNPAPNLILVAILILIVSSTPIIAFWLAEGTEWEAVKAIKVDGCCHESAEAIVLLGQGTTQPRIPNRVYTQLTSTGDRIPFAAFLYRQKLAPYIIVSAGPRPEISIPVSEAIDIRKLLTHMGIPHDKIILETKGTTARTSAERVKQILKDKGMESKIILVTSAIEIRRASLTFADLGIKVIPRATNFYSFQSTENLPRRIGGEDFFPSAEALLVTTRIIDEYLKFFYYFLRGWLAPNI